MSSISRISGLPRGRLPSGMPDIEAFIAVMQLGIHPNDVPHGRYTFSAGPYPVICLLPILSLVFLFFDYLFLECV